MNGLIDLLNQNQGVIAVIAIGVPVIGGTIAWLFKRNKDSNIHTNSPYVKAGHSITAGGDIIVGGSKTNIANESLPTVVIKPDGFTHNSGRYDLIFENSGSATAIVQKLVLGKDEANIDEFSLSPQQKITKHLNVSGFKILDQKLDTPNFELVYKDFSTGKKYKTVGTISQNSRADGKFNLGKLKDLQFVPLQALDQPENEELEILKFMQNEMKRDNEGNAYLMKVDRLPYFVKVGKKVFGKEENPVEMKKYGECLLNLEQKGFVERKSDKRFVLTVKGSEYKDNHQI